MDFSDNSIIYYQSNSNFPDTKNYFSNNFASSDENSTIDKYFKQLCDVNYSIPDWIDGNTLFGYARSIIPFIIIPVVSILLNLIAIYASYKNIKKIKNKIVTSIKKRGSRFSICSIYSVDNEFEAELENKNKENTDSNLISNYNNLLISFKNKISSSEKNISKLNLSNSNENNNNKIDENNEDIYNNLRKKYSRSIISSDNVDNMEDIELQTLQPSSSVEKMLFILIIFQCFQMIFITIRRLLLRKVSDIHNKCGICFCVSIVSVSCQIFQFGYFCCLLHNIYLIINQPFKENEFNYRIKRYFFYLIILVGAYILMLFQFSLFGRSPILSCSMRNDFTDKPEKILGLYLILSFPIGFFFAYSYFFLKIFSKRQFYVFNEIKVISIKIFVYLLIMVLFYLPVAIVYYTTINKKIHRNTIQSYMSYFANYSEIGSNFILSIWRILDAYCDVSWKFFTKNEDTELNSIVIPDGQNEEINDDYDNENDNINNCRNDTNDSNCDDNKITKDSKKSILSFSNLDKGKERKSQLSTTRTINFSLDLIKNYVKNIFVGTSLCLNHSLKNKSKYLELKDFKKKYTNSMKSFNFDSESRKVDDDFSELNIDSYLLKNKISVNVIEHCSEYFEAIRNLEKLDVANLIKSLIATNSSNAGSNNGGKSNALFLPTINNKYLIKTMEETDFSTLSGNSFMTYYYLHLRNNPDSLICRFYGVFSIDPNMGGQPMKIILMRNLKGPFKKFIRGTYDLKGSTMNRKVEVCSGSKQKSEIDNNVINVNKKSSLTDVSNSNNTTNISNDYFVVKKDLNFDEEIGGMNLTLEDKERFVNNLDKDIDFFEDNGIMDYSLFVFKLEMSEKELEDLSNYKDFNDYYKKYFYMSCQRSERRINTIKRSHILSLNKKTIDSLTKYNDDDSSNVEMLKPDKSSDKSLNDSLSKTKARNNNLNTLMYFNEYKQKFNKDIEENNEYEIVYHCYLIMIIDYLQLYDFNKRLETRMKGMFYSGDASSCPPSDYSKRFKSYCKLICSNKGRSFK